MRRRRLSAGTLEEECSFARRDRKRKSSKYILFDLKTWHVLLGFVEVRSIDSSRPSNRNLVLLKSLESHERRT